MSFENARADVAVAGFVIENIGYGSFCILQRDSNEFQSLRETFIDGQTQPFKYRVWGKAFRCTNCPTSFAGAIVRYVQIDKIETVN